MQAPDRQTEIAIEFREGIPVSLSLDDKTLTDPVEMLGQLNEVGGANGIGRVDMVENRFVGMKSRGVYETPGYAILRAAHMDLEGLTVDREVLHLRDQLMPKIASLMYNGFWYAPEMRFLMAAVDESQKHVTGTVKAGLYKGNITILGRKSPESLYDEDVASMDVHGGYDQMDAVGFIKLNALRLRNWSSKHAKLME
jgi:argininosuccinate synthase